MGVQKINVGNGNLKGGASRAEGLEKLKQFEKDQATTVLRELRTSLIGANNRPKHGVLKLVNSSKVDKEMAFARKNGLDRWFSRADTFANTSRALEILLQKSGIDSAKAQELLLKAKNASGLGGGQIKYDAATDMIDEALALGQRQESAKAALNVYGMKRSALPTTTVKDLYGKYQVPISDKTLPGTYTQAEDLMRVGGGKVSNVFKGKFDHEGMKSEYFYKEMSPPGNPAAMYGAAADTIGIDPDSPQVGCRNIATGLVDKLLGFGVTAESRFVVMKNGGQNALGLLMDQAVGKTPDDLRNYRDELRANPDLRRQLTKLQLLDAVVGQADRHQGNYIINYDANKKTMNGLKGIDNDSCFGKKTLNPSELVYHNSGIDKGVRGVALPDVIDKDMYAAISDLAPQDLEKELQPLLSRREVDAAKARLGAVQQHINNAQKCQVIDPSDWGSKDVTAILQRRGLEAGKDYCSSYIGRDFY